MEFYLGTHQVHWLQRSPVPLFVSVRRLKRQRTHRPAACRWAVDSGAFTEISTYGRWQTSEQDYLKAVMAVTDGLGEPDWIAPQDWMCEPWIIQKTGLSIPEHQHRTVLNVLSLRAQSSLWVVPVLQGWAIGDYLDHIDLYDKLGVDLRAEPVVGVGSVCRRQGTREIQDLFRLLHAFGLRLHGFGVKSTGLPKISQYLVSADSMAWSFCGRRNKPAYECGLDHMNCANCYEYAMWWRSRILENIP